MTSPTALNQQPAGWARRAAILDDTAPHQVRLTVSSNGNRLAWSCTCRKSHGGYPALGSADGLSAVQILAAHRAHVAEAGVLAGVPA